MPESAGQALAVMDAALDYLNGPGMDSLEAPALGGVLESLGGLSAKFAAVRATVLARFDAAGAHDEDGYGSTVSWLAARGKMTRRAASAQVRQMRQLREHPEIRDALARQDVSESWAEQMAEWTRRFPPEWRAEIDRLLLGTAAAGASLEDLAIVAQAAYEKWRQSQEPDPDGDPDDGFEDRYLKLGATLDGVGRLNGDLTRECAQAVQAVLEALGKKAGPEDDRTEQQRYHDALQLACEMLIRARMLPDRAGTDTRVDAVISLAELLALPGASKLQEAWLAAMAGEPGYLAGKDAEVIACDALIVPVVTGHLDLTAVDRMIDVLLACLDDAHKAGRDRAPDPARGSDTDPASDIDPASDGAPASNSAPGSEDHDRHPVRSRALSPEAWQALRYAIARLAVELVSGPGGLASVLRRGLLDEPYTSKSVILDIGYSVGIPPHIRRAVQLRARGCCEWPGCQRRAAYCDVHHLVHKRDGGETSVSNCALLCQFHHDVCVHRHGWRLVLHPDAATTAYGPHGQVLHSSRPPRSQGPPDQGPSGQGPPGPGP